MSPWVQRQKADPGPSPILGYQLQAIHSKKNILDELDRGEDDILGEKLGLRKTEEGGSRHPGFDFQKSHVSRDHTI